jgi:putative ABC transport system ATP-binding protein
LLTLFGALRGAQSGKLRVLGHELVGIEGAALTEIRRNIGFIFQMHNLLESLTALENVVLATHLTGMSRTEALERGTGLLQRLGLGHRLHHKPSALSGGQRQRVAVARAMVNEPKLILADEPTAALDKESSLEVVALLHEHAVSRGAAVVIVTHDNRIIDRADRIMAMVDGSIVSDVTVGEVVAICEFLRGVEVFARLNTGELTAVAEKMHSRLFKDGEVLIRQGDVGEEFFLLFQGQADVLVSAEGVTSQVASLERGRYFGERSLLTGEVRNATIVGRGEGKVFVLGKPDFEAALEMTPSLRDQLRSIYFGR